MNRSQSGVKGRKEERKERLPMSPRERGREREDSVSDHAK